MTKETSDAVNGGFEALGGMLILINIARVLNDKKVEGVSVIPTTFWTAWGAWNCYFYPVNGMWVSFAGGIIVVVTNAVWVTLAIYYLKNPVDSDNGS